MLKADKLLRVLRVLSRDIFLKNGGIFALLRRAKINTDWPGNSKSVEFPGIWESVFSSTFNYGEFAKIESKYRKEIEIKINHNPIPKELVFRILPPYGSLL